MRLIQMSVTENKFMSTRMTRLHILLSLALLSACEASFAATPIRAIFDEAIYWARNSANPESIIAARLNKVKKAGFNTYIPCVWHGRGAIWNSKVVEPWYQNPALARKDPLKQFIELAHERNIQVMPCFTVMLRQHDFYPEFATAQRPNMFDVHNAKFREFIKSVILEVVENYDIDGINLDYIRAGQVCHKKRCREQYKTYTGHDLMADLAIRRTDQDARNRIVEWQRNAVGGLVSDISSAARKIKPDIQITVSGGLFSDSGFIEGRDSIRWANDGLIDLILAMNYQKDIPWPRLQNVREQMVNPEKLAIMVANYNIIEGDAADKRPVIRNSKGKALESKKGHEMVAIVSQAKEFNALGSYAVYLYSKFTDEQASYLEKYYQRPQ